MGVTEERVIESHAALKDALESLDIGATVLNDALESRLDPFSEVVIDERVIE